MICRCRKGARCLTCILRDGLTRAAGCTCDPRFRDVAHDIDCPVHGISAELEPRRAGRVIEVGEITADSSTRGRLVAIVDVGRAGFAEPDEIAVSCPLQHKGAPIETIYGIPLVIDETVPVGAIEVRSRNGQHLVESFYTSRTVEVA